MGAGRSAGSSGGRSSVDAALDHLKSDYPLNSKGYFGEIGRSGSEDKRQIKSTDPLATFHEIGNALIVGAKRDDGVVVKNGVSFLHPDGTRINLRQPSSSGSPAIDITSNNAKLATQRIHFEGETDG